MRHVSGVCHAVKNDGAVRNRFADLLRDRADPRFKGRVALLWSLFEYENLRFALGLIAMRHGSGLPVQGREGRESTFSLLSHCRNRGGGRKWIFV